jgi:hypothetical protein
MFLESSNYKSSNWHFRLRVLKKRQFVTMWHKSSLQVAMSLYSCWLVKCLKSHKHNKTVAFGVTREK